MEIALQGHYGYRRLAVSSIPSILMMLVGSIYSVVDGLFVSNFVGTSAFAALNIIWPAVMLVGALGLMVGTGGSALVSKTMGEGDYYRASQIFTMLVKFTVILSLVFMVPLLVFMEPLARLLGAEGETARLCVVYGSICTIGLPAFMLQMCFQSFYMTAERPRLGTVMSARDGDVHHLRGHEHGAGRAVHRGVQMGACRGGGRVDARLLRGWFLPAVVFFESA